MITIKITNKFQIENVRIRNFCARPHFCVCSVLCSNDYIYGHENEMYNVGVEVKEGEKSVNEGVTCGLGGDGR